MGGVEEMDVDQFYSLQVGQRLDYFAKKIMLTGMQRPWWMYFWHFCVWFINYGSWVLFAVFVPKPAYMGAGDHGRLIYAKLVVWQHFMEAVGCRQGPLGGMGLPTNWKYRLSRGTIKLPTIPGLWTKRNWIDTIVNATFFISCLLFMFSQDYGYLYIRIVCACDVFIFLADMTQFYASTGHGYWTMLLSLCVAPDAGQLAGVQIALIFQWFFSGIGKAGPWFSYVNGPFMIQSRLLRGTRWLFNLLFKSAEDLSPTKIGIVLAHTAAAVEYVAPICLMIPNYYVICFGILGLTAMHIYILTMPAPFDVYSWNTCYMLSGVYLFWLNGVLFGGGAASEPIWIGQEGNNLLALLGFDWLGVQQLLQKSPWLAAVLFGEFSLCWYGQFFPDQVGYYLSHRYWAGNWVQSVFFAKQTDAVKAKFQKMIDERKTFEGNPMNQVPDKKLKFFYESFGYMAFAYLWVATFNMKMIIRMIQDAMDLYGTEFDEWRGIGLCNFCAGEFRDQLYAPKMVPTIQEEMQFEEGECFMISLGSFGMFRNTAYWKIYDMKKGILAEGRVTKKNLQAMHSLPSKSLDKTIVLGTDKDNPLLGA